MGLRVIMEGFGGQAVQSAGDLLVTTLFATGYRAQGMPIYSPLQMGGPVTFSLAIEPDGDRVVPQRDRDAYIMMHRRLFDLEHAETVRPGGLMLLNADEAPPEFSDIGRDVAVIGADALAREHGLVRANVPHISTVMVGAFARLCDVIDYATLERSVREAFPKFVTGNMRALRAGYEQVAVVSAAPVGV